MSLERLRWIIHHEKIFQIHGRSIRDFTPFTSDLMIDFYKVVYCIDDVEAILLERLKAWHKKWLDVRDKPLHFPSITSLVRELS